MAEFSERTHEEKLERAEQALEHCERIAIASYTELINWLEGKDPTSHKLMREILAVEEEHAEDMASLMRDTK